MKYPFLEDNDPLNVETNVIYFDECLKGMQKLPNESIDMILCDLPYGTTQNRWDNIIDLTSLWKQYTRIIKPNCAIVLTGSQPFSSKLVLSNLDMFKWEYIWHKSRATGHLNCKVMPLREHENILVFGKGKLKYNPQLEVKPVKNIRPEVRYASTECYGKYKNTAKRSIPIDKQYPRSVININSTNHGERGLHPTQKPIALMEYLINTFSNQKDLILDNCIGSGTTAIAAINTGRLYIGFENNKHYFNIAQERIKKRLARR